MRPSARSKICTNCGLGNSSTYSSCLGCRTPLPREHLHEYHRENEDETFYISCPRCTYLNFSFRLRCKICMLSLEDVKIILPTDGKKVEELGNLSKNAMKKLAKAYEREEEARRVCLGEPNPTRRASSSFDEMKTCMKCGTENSSVMPTVCTGCDALSLNNPRMLPSAKEKVEKRIQDGVIHRTKMAKRIAEKLKLPPIVINSPELKPDDDLTKTPKRLKMEQELALKSQQEHFCHFNLRERCVETLIDSLDEAKECMEILIHFHKILFKCDKIHTHCIDVITKQFIQYIYDLYKDPSYDDKTEELDDLVNFETMVILGIYYHGGREHLVKDHFTLFMEKLPTHLRLEVLTRLYDAMAKEFKQHYKARMKLPKNHNAHNVLHNTMKALKARRLRYVELLLWIGSSGDFKEEKNMVDEILMGKNGKGVFFSVDHQAVVKEIDDSRSSERMISIDVGHLTWNNAGWYYHEAYSRNLFCLTAVVEKFIKENWILVTQCAPWILLVDEKRKEMLEYEYQFEMMAFYRQQEEKSSQQEDMVDFYYEDEEEFSWYDDMEEQDGSEEVW